MKVKYRRNRFESTYYDAKVLFRQKESNQETGLLIVYADCEQLVLAVHKENSDVWEFKSDDYCISLNEQSKDILKEAFFLEEVEILSEDISEEEYLTFIKRNSKLSAQANDTLTEKVMAGGKQVIYYIFKYIYQYPDESLLLLSLLFPMEGPLLTKEVRGKITEVIKAWVKWAENKGYIQPNEIVKKYAVRVFDDTNNIVKICDTLEQAEEETKKTEKRAVYIQEFYEKTNFTLPPNGV